MLSIIEFNYLHMEKSKFTTTVLKASDGFKLTQVDESISLLERVVAKVVCVGKNDSAENWKEIPDDEAAEIVAAKNAEIKAEHERQKNEQQKPSALPQEGGAK